jgi:hypothetical protein
MSVVLDGATIGLTGDCGVEEAELLLSLLLADPQRRVELSGAHRLHTALFQVLLCLRPALSGSPADPFFAKWLLPLLVLDRVAV